MFSRIVLTALALSLFVTQAHAQIVFDESGLVTKAGSNVAVPEPLNFAIATAGRYRIQMSDIGASAAVNSKLIVTRGITVAARLDAPGAIEVDLTSGSYTLRMSGRAPANSSSQLAAVVSRNGTQLAAHSIGLVPLSPPDPRLVNVQEIVHIAHAGNYSVELTDRNFPAAISGLQAILTLSGVPVVCIPASPACANASNSFIANPGDYQLNVIGTANAAAPAGLFSVRVADAANNRVAYAKTHAVGKLMGAATELPVASQPAVLSATDHAFPVALAQLHVALVQGANFVALRNVSTASVSATLTATAGIAELYTYAIPAANTSGMYGLLVRQGDAVLLSDVRAANHDAPSPVEAFNYQVTVSSAGAYQIRVHDFAMPALGGLSFTVSQGGELLAMADSASTLSVDAGAGVLDISIVATARTGEPVVKGLFGIAVARSNVGTSLWEKTQGVGDLFQSRSIEVSDAGRYQIAFVDQRFPTSFTELVLVVTRGATLVSSIYAAGGTAPTQTTIDTTRGEYAVNLLAVANGGDNYGLYGIKLEDITPPPPAPIPAPPTSTANAVESGGGGSMEWRWVLAGLLALMCKRARRNLIRKLRNKVLHRDQRRVRLSLEDHVTAINAR